MIGSEFQLERRDNTTQQVTQLVNRIPPKAGDGPVQADRHFVGAIADPAAALDRPQRGCDYTICRIASPR